MIRGDLARPVLSSSFWAVPPALLLVALFLVLSFVSASLSTAPIIGRTQAAFAGGDLVEQDYLRDDKIRGENQYNDCMVLQLIISPDSDMIEKALAPRVYVPDPSYSDVCRTLRHLANNSADRTDLYSERYARYWHGYAPAKSALLRIAGVAEVRNLLRAFVLASLSLLLFSALATSGPLRIFGACVAVSGLLFWGLPYYGQAFSFAPGDGALTLGIAALVRWRDRLLVSRPLAIFCGAYGAILTYFEFLTAQLPTAAGLLFVAAYLMGCQAAPDSQIASRSDWQRAFVALLSFSIGAILAVALKQLLAMALLGPAIAQPFLEHLLGYAGISGNSRGLLATYFEPFKSLMLSTTVLAYRSRPGAAALLTLTLLAWALATLRALRSKSSMQRNLFAAHLVGSWAVVAWTILFPEHTRAHAPFMVRMFIVPISLGWSAMLIQSDVAKLKVRGQYAVSKRKVSAQLRGDP